MGGDLLRDKVFADDWLTVYAGDNRAILPTLPAESVHCVVTSPPYWGLRDYGTATWLGGDEGCDHTVSNPDADNKAVFAERVHRGDRSACRKCGAARQDSQLGLEPTPEQYVENIVAVFREVRRVLRSDGTLWLNLGDSYAANGAPGLNVSTPSATFHGGKADAHERRAKRVPAGLKPKDLVGIPWRVAFALQVDGWYLRSDIIWSKPNPMPESVTDRPTKSHEYLFLLAKSPRYYFDADAVRESGTTGAWGAMPPIGGVKHPGNNGNATYSGNQPPSDGNRNIRSVWTIPTQPSPGAHFAVFPPKLVEPCIKAGTSERGVCPQCGAPWRRVVRVTAADGRSVEKPASQRFASVDGKPLVGDNRFDIGVRASWNSNGVLPTRDEAGWQPTCAHAAEPVPAVALDPFAGSGTVGMVAQSLSRRACLIDLNPDYIKQQLRRNRDVPLGLAG